MYIEDLDNIPVGIMQQALEDSRFPVTVASDLMGWGKDSTRLRMALGYRPNRRGVVEVTVPYELACRMILSWNLDPVDYGV
jgi:hypothetical protein